MLTPLKDCEILKRYSQPPGENARDTKQQTGNITAFPNAPLDLPTETFANALNKREQNRIQLLQWIKENLKPDIDYGRIHLDERCRFAKAGSPHLCHEFSHWSRPMLFKSGAERIAGVLGLTAHFPNLHQYELACVHRQEIQAVVLKCELRTSNGVTVAEGAGARHIKEDGWKINTSINMACRSALIDAVIRVARLSGLFISRHMQTLTQMGDCNKNDMPGRSDCHESLPARADCNRNGLPTGSDCNGPNEKPITQKQQHLVQYLAGRKGLTTDAMEKHCQSLFHKPLNDLDRVQASRFINTLIDNNG
ncbi:MAG: hypothetical protein V1793_07700 [Pseudomonadota bacterium]